MSSSCAMVAMYHRRVGSDDAYNRIRAPFGDTTNPSAHLAALRSMGLRAEFVTHGTRDLLVAEITNGRPVAVGWLYHGDLLSGPSGGGHWSVIVGYTATHSVHHDPYGEADMLGGGYINANRGREIRYSWRNWLQRWEVANQGGRYRHSPGNGWAILVRP